MRLNKKNLARKRVTEISKNNKTKSKRGSLTVGTSRYFYATKLSSMIEIMLFLPYDVLVSVSNDEWY